jgi:hypothetical protein
MVSKPGLGYGANGFEEFADTQYLNKFNGRCVLLNAASSYVITAQ